MKNYLFLIIGFITCLTATAQSTFIKDSLDNYITKGIKDWNIPGLAIVIVKDGKSIVMKGYGVRDLDTKEPVDENTLFMIASNSKLFTGTALAQLDYNKQLSLNDKITKYFPWYSAYDNNTTQLVTIKDMLGHHLGTKTFQGDFTFWNTTLSRDSIIYKMRYLQPSLPFRTSFGYCNSCFLTAGEIIQKVTGKPWEVYVYDSIIVPAGMGNTHTLSKGMGSMQNAATPYTNTFSENLTKLPYDDIDNIAPAGSMISCVKDLSRWLILQLDSGKIDGKQVLPWKAIQQTRDANTLISTRRNGNGMSHFTTYSLGIFETDYNGKQIYWHTGGADGFVTNTCFVPEENLGIAILTNNDNQEFFELLRYQILNAYFGLPFTNISDKALAGARQEHTKTISDINALKLRVKGNKPALPLDSYAGIYNNELFGNIYLSVNGNNLLMRFDSHRDLTASLQYMDKDEWLLTYNNPAFGIFPLRFSVEDKKVISTGVKVNDFLEYDAYTFIKK